MPNDSRTIADVERMVFGFEMWTPAKVAEPRMVLGYEARYRGELLVLRSDVYTPGPFDALDDVFEHAGEILRRFAREVSGTDD